ncbi:uncharacterized protein [Musca autumnalis]|uniref:uncharacterized protein n=1 Tax=Musca autumnalis TaxID=221902 RepID=UPI003CF03243
MDILEAQENKENNSYQKLLNNIYMERNCNSLLVVYDAQQTSLEPIIQSLYKLNWPTNLLTKTQGEFLYRMEYNKEILAVLLLTLKMNVQLMEIMANVLNFMRETRIVVIAVDVLDQQEFQQQLLENCKDHNMTNVLLSFTSTQKQSGHGSRMLYFLKPYPIYHWSHPVPATDLSNLNLTYYPQHWRNLHNKTLLTYVDKASLRSLYYKDEQGNLKINGYVPRFVMLFAERYNATLEMIKPLDMVTSKHFKEILAELVETNLIDIPMSMDSNPHYDRWFNMTDVFYHDRGMLMVPCVQALSIREVYAIILNATIIGSILVGTVIFSLLQSLIDYIFDGLLEPTKLVFSVRIFPAVLGQSFTPPHQEPRKILKFVYLLLFMTGLFLNTIFSVNVSTLLTSPPKHAQIKTLEDIVDSKMKVLLQDAEAFAMRYRFEGYEKYIVTTQNISYVEALKNDYNTSYVYYVSSPGWEKDTLRQQFLTHKPFCTYDDLVIYPYLPWGIPLQNNSPYRDGLNYLLHLVHAYGFMEYWSYDTFADLLKLKQVSIRDPYVDKGPQQLGATDLFWTWMILIVGLFACGLVFLAEIWWHHRKSQNTI